jgi:hypothetical protein
MKTISSIHFDKLIAEASEADEIGLTKVAENITRQIEKVSVREGDVNYSYNSKEFKQDIQDNLWSIIIRVADFHGTHFDSKNAQSIVDDYSNRIVAEVRKTFSLAEMGAHEPSLPGVVDKVVLEVDE